MRRLFYALCVHLFFSFLCAEKGNNNKISRRCADYFMPSAFTSVSPFSAPKKETTIRFAADAQIFFPLR